MIFNTSHDIEATKNQILAYLNRHGSVRIGQLETRFARKLNECLFSLLAGGQIVIYWLNDRQMVGLPEAVPTEVTAIFAAKPLKNVAVVAELPADKARREQQKELEQRQAEESAINADLERQYQLEKIAGIVADIQNNWRRQQPHIRQALEHQYHQQRRNESVQPAIEAKKMDFYKFEWNRRQPGKAMPAALAEAEPEPIREWSV